MSYLNRVWMAASVAVLHSHTDQSHKLKPGLKSLHHGGKRCSSPSSAYPSGCGGDAVGLRPFSGMLGSDATGFLGNSSGDERRKQADESIWQVMYLNCWGPS